MSIGEITLRPSCCSRRATRRYSLPSPPPSCDDGWMRLLAALVTTCALASITRAAPGPTPPQPPAPSKPRPDPANHLPVSLTKTDITEGVAKVRGQVQACGAKSSAKGTVKLQVVVLGKGT